MRVMLMIKGDPEPGAVPSPGYSSAFAPDQSGNDKKCS
jgi:hypothetical protein